MWAYVISDEKRRSYSITMNHSKEWTACGQIQKSNKVKKEKMNAHEIYPLIDPSEAQIV